MRHLEQLLVILIILIFDKKHSAVVGIEIKGTTGDDEVPETSTADRVSTAMSSSTTTADVFVPAEAEQILLEKKVYNGRIAGAVIGGFFMGVVTTLTVVVLVHHFVSRKSKDETRTHSLPLAKTEEITLGVYDTVCSQPATTANRPAKENVGPLYGNVPNTSQTQPVIHDTVGEYEEMQHPPEATGETNQGFQDPHVYAKVS